MGLSRLLTAREPDSIVLLGPGATLRAEGLQALAARLARSQLVGQTVAIWLSDPLETVRSMLALDRVARSLLLLSPDLSGEHASKLMASAGVTTVLSDQSDISGPVWQNVDNVPIQSEPIQTDPFETNYLLTTSGTTGLPKIVEHSLESLSRTTIPDPTRFAEAHWGLLYGATRFAGLQVILQAVLSHSPLLLPSPGCLQGQLRFLAASKCTHLSCSPTLWRRILMAPEASELPLQQITLGGEAADQTTLDRLAHKFPDARIVHIYASTEAGVGFRVKDGKAGFPASFLTDPPAGVSLQIRNGVLFLRKLHGSGTYLDGRSFTKDGFVNTGDLVEQSGDRVLFAGRTTGVINVGGDKVSPEKVEHVLESHPEVALARAYGKKNSIMGHLVAAEVQPVDPEHPPARLDLLKHCKTRLAKYEMPTMITFVDQITMNDGGKKKRHG